MSSTDLSRRGFFKAGAIMATAFGFDLRLAAQQARELKISRTTQTHSVCPYCAVGCSVVIHTLGDRARNVKPTVVHVEGDPDSPINGGTLCPKGAAQMQLAMSPRLEKGPKYREAGASEWTDVTWDFAMEWFARKFKDSRDASFVEQDGEGRTVNRCEGIGWVGSATVANEDAYLITKTMRAMGLVYIDHQARI